MGSVPYSNGYVSVQMMEGRGNADVVQQPNSRNNYTTVVRIRDRQSGAGRYAVAAYWQPSGNYGYGNSRVYNDGQYNNGRYDNGDYNDGRYDNGQYGRGQYGQYGQYPQQVIVQRPVYGNRGEGKSLPVPQRGNAYPSRGDARYPAQAVPGFPNPNPNPNPAGGRTYPRPTQAPPVVNQQSSGNRDGKTLPGTSQSDRQHGSHHGGH
jgi:hypothetical protein